MSDLSPAPPRPASTIVLLRDSPAGLEVCMVVRHHEIDFASGALVFPGGRLEPSDAELAAGICSGDCRPRLEDDPLLSFKVAAIREVYEECGVLVARPRGGEGLIEAGRVRPLDRKSPFAELMAREGLIPAADALVAFARWITPAFMPKRFDTHFFLALAPPGQALAHDGREAVDSIWISPREALAQQGRKFKLLFPTERNLWKLARFDNAASALEAARAAPVVTVEPERIEVDGGPGLRISVEADYGGEIFSVRGLL
jgi:8-oxo-dGTP pyrophosphatase MutT (NUDIX family)